MFHHRDIEHLGVFQRQTHQGRVRSEAARRRQGRRRALRAHLERLLETARDRRLVEGGSGGQDSGEVDALELGTSELEAEEQFILSIASDGLGKRTSAYEYRIAGRGGQGVANMDLSRPGQREVRVVGAFPVNPGDQLVLVTDSGKLIRCPVHDIRIAGRSTRGVRLFDVAEDERVVSVARLADDGEPDGEDDSAEPESEA